MSTCHEIRKAYAGLRTKPRHFASSDLPAARPALPVRGRTALPPSGSSHRVKFPPPLDGAFVALLLTGNQLDVPSMIGLVMQMGIGTENSILLFEYAVLARHEQDL